MGMNLTDTYAEHGIVAAGPPSEPAEAGLLMLKEGGNAVDAAVAAALVESAVNPNVSGIGGSGGMMIYLASQQRCFGIDYNTAAPAQADDRFLESAYRSLAPNRRAQMMAAGWNAHQMMIVPGCVAGLHLAVSKYGRRTWREVAAPALEALDGGLYIHERLARETPGMINGCDTDEGRRLLTIDGQPPRLGERLPLKPFVELFEQIAEGGAEVFYRGEIANQLIHNIGQHGGILTKVDLAEYSAREVEPVAVSYRGYDVCTCPPTLGGATVLEILNVLEGYDPVALGPDTPEWADLLARVFRLAWSDRLNLLGDPGHAEVDLDRLLSKEYAASLRERVEKAEPPGRPSDWRGWPGTIHISAADREGNMVALTQSLIGGSHFVPDLGLLMNQALVMFDPRPGHPNCPGPRKRPLVNMSPTIILKDGRPLFALGAPGARHIVSAVSHMIVNLIDFGMGPSEAIAAPRIHCEADGPVLVEACAHESVRDGLTAAGHEAQIADRIAALGHIVGIDAERHRLVAASDPRRSRSQWGGRVGTVAAS